MNEVSSGSVLLMGPFGGRLRERSASEAVGVYEVSFAGLMVPGGSGRHQLSIARRTVQVAVTFEERLVDSKEYGTMGCGCLEMSVGESQRCSEKP